MKTKDAYRLSRVQAEGWNAARTRRSSDPDNLDLAAIEAVCPYHGDPEKERWVAGFRSSLNARYVVPGKEPGANPPIRPRKTLHLRDV